MTPILALSVARISYILLAFIVFFLLFSYLNINSSSLTTTLNIKYPYTPSYTIHLKNTFTQVNGWQVVGHTHEEQVRLHDMAIVVAAWPQSAEDNIPTVPCVSADSHLLVLSAAASRVRYGVSVTFVMVYPTDVKRVLPKQTSVNPLSSYLLNLWCIFDDGSVMPAYSYDSKYGNDRASLLDCPLSPFASDQLWRYNRTLRVYLASMTDKNRNTPILKAFVVVPIRPSIPSNSSQQLLTMCTSPLHNNAEYLLQWIEFHRLVGFRKFVIYNTTDTHLRLSSVLNIINRKYQNLVDIVPWNFSSLGLTDVLSTRYFQTESLHDCLIRYGDQSEWLGMLDLDEYIVPLAPYETVLDYLYDNYGRQIVGSVNLWSQFFCTKENDKYTSEENDTRRLIIERFTLRAADRHKGGREKYLFRPRFVQYLSIHHQIVGLSKQEPSKNHIMLAHYAAMNHVRTMPGCSAPGYVTDISVRDRFATRVKREIASLTI